MQVPSIPLFPLPSGVLLPGGLMPLHVFEARYRAMVAQVVDQPPTQRRIAIALLGDGYEPVYQTLAAPIHPVVCVGRLTQYELLADGRYNLLLAGRWRGRIVSEDRSGCFRRALIERMPTDMGAFDDAAPNLLASLERLAQRLVSGGLVEQRLMNWIVEDSTTPDLLIDRLAYYVLPQADAELRQAILAEPDLRRRVETLVRGLEARMARHLEQSSAPAAGPPWPPAWGTN